MIEVMRSVEIEKSTGIRKANEAFYSERAIARASAPITGMWLKLRGRQGVGRLYSPKKKKKNHHFALMGGGWQRDAGSKLTRSGGVLSDWFGECIWLSVVGSELEAGTK